MKTWARAIVLIFAFCLGAGTVCIFAWLAGFDFNERGAGAALVALFSVVLGLWMVIGAHELTETGR